MTVRLHPEPQVVSVSQGHGKCWKGQCGCVWEDLERPGSWDALIQVLNGTALRGHHTKQHRVRMYIKSLFQQSLCGKAKTVKYFP